jgi:tRNA threonylcarbamoyladenosine biosynthesis protein TsaB
MIIASRNEENTCTVVLDIGMRQSEKILPAVDYVLAQTGLVPDTLDFTVLCEGPGSFTGLRLGFSALKAIELAHNTPIYAIPSLEVYAYPFSSFSGNVIPVIDAKKDQFFAAVYRNGKIITGASDTTPDKLASQLDPNVPVLITGPDAVPFSAALTGCNPAIKTTQYKFLPLSTESLFCLAAEKIMQKQEPLKDFDGPGYLRKSEAELSLGT